jgi:phage gp29-like protein
MVDLCNDEISKLILGQTETTQSSDTSGYAQASVHADVENDINKADRNFVRRILNKRLVRIFEANGIDTKGGRFSIKVNEKVNEKDRIAIDAQLKNDIGLPMSDDYFYETYGVKKPDNYEELKGKGAGEDATTTDPPKTDPDTPPAPASPPKPEA